MDHTKTGSRLDLAQEPQFATPLYNINSSAFWCFQLYVLVLEKYEEKKERTSYHLVSDSHQ